jgi:septin family protein
MTESGPPWSSKTLPLPIYVIINRRSFISPQLAESLPATIIGQNSPCLSSSYQVLQDSSSLLKTAHESNTVLVDSQHGSRSTATRRKCNVRAASRYRARQKELDHSKQAMIENQKQEKESLTKERESLSKERDFLLRQLVNCSQQYSATPGQGPYL